MVCMQCICAVDGTALVDCLRARLVVHVGVRMCNRLVVLISWLSAPAGVLCVWSGVQLSCTTAAATNQL